MTEQATGRKMVVHRYGMTGPAVYSVGFITRFIGIGQVLGGVKSPDSNGDTGDTRMKPDRGSTSYPGTPRWVKLFEIVVIVLVLLVVIIIFILGHTAPVQHGP